MNHFAILVHGDGFDPEWASERLQGITCECWHKGKPKVPGYEDSGCYATSGIRIELGDGANLSVWEQQRVAVEFLKQNERALCEISASPDSEHFIVGIEHHVPYTESTIGFCTSFTKAFLLQSLAVGAGPTTYVVLDRSGGEV